MLQFALEKDVLRALMTFSLCYCDDAARLLLFAVWRAQESIATIRNNAALTVTLCAPDISAIHAGCVCVNFSATQRRPQLCRVTFLQLFCYANIWCGKLLFLANNLIVLLKKYRTCCLINKTLSVFGQLYNRKNIFCFRCGRRRQRTSAAFQAPD